MAEIYINAKLGDSEANSYVTRNEASEYYARSYTDTANWTNLTATQREQTLIQAAHDIEMLNYKGKKFYEVQALSFPRDYNDAWEGTASPATASRLVVRAKNLYSGTYNEMPNNHFKYGTIHIREGQNRGSSRRIASSLATETGRYGELYVASPFPSNVAASDNFIAFEPIQNEVKWAQCEQALYIAANRFYGYGDYAYSGIGYVRTGDLGMSFKDSQGTITGRKVSLKARKLLGRHIRKTIKYGRA